MILFWSTLMKTDCRVHQKADFFEQKGCMAVQRFDVSQNLARLLELVANPSKRPRIGKLTARRVLPSWCCGYVR